MRILIIRYSSLGDVVISSAVLKAVYEHFKTAQIDFLTDNRYTPVLIFNPYLNNVIGINRETDRIFEYFRLKRILDKYDIVFDLQNKFFSKMIVRRIDAKQVFRFSKRAYCNNKKEEHILNLYEAFLKDKGIELRDKRYFLFYKKNEGDKTIAINIEGGHISKRFSAGQIFHIVKNIREAGFSIVLIGTKSSKTLARDIMCKFTDVEDTTSCDVKGLIETISRLSVLITPDSGPLHIAAGLGIPVVTVFGSTSYKKWLPMTENISLIKSDYGCSPCSEYGTSICRYMKSFGCIRDISPDIITLEALRLYEQNKKKD